MISPVQPAGGWRAVSTGAGIVLLAVGAILRFAIAAASSGNVHIVGVTLMLAGAFGLLVSLLVRVPLNRHRGRFGA